MASLQKGRAVKWIHDWKKCYELPLPNEPVLCRRGVKPAKHKTGILELDLLLKLLLFNELGNI